MSVCQSPGECVADHFVLQVVHRLLTPVAGTGDAVVAHGRLAAETGSEGILTGSSWSWTMLWSWTRATIRFSSRTARLRIDSKTVFSGWVEREPAESLETW